MIKHLSFKYGQLIKYQDPVKSNHLRSTGLGISAALLINAEDSTHLFIYLAQMECRADESFPF